LISEGLDRHEKHQRDDKAWDASLESRDSLRATYGDLGGIDQTLRQFLGLYEQIRQSPLDGAAPLFGLSVKLNSAVIWRRRGCPNASGQRW
jgi:hypothetical protein